MDETEIVAAIQAAIRRKGTNPSRLAKENGWSVNAVRYILEGRRPSSSRLAEVCKALGLEFYVGPPRMPGGSQLNAERLADELERLAAEARRLARASRPRVTEIDQGLYASAPLYSVLAAAGEGLTVDTEEVKGYLGFNRTWLRSQRLAADKLAVIEVRGDSMEPTLYGGDTVLLDMQAHPLRDREIYTLRRENDLLVKRLRRKGSEWRIVSDNPAYSEETLGPEHAVVGKVVWLGRVL